MNIKKKMYNKEKGRGWVVVQRSIKVMTLVEAVGEQEEAAQLFLLLLSSSSYYYQYCMQAAKVENDEMNDDEIQIK